MSRSDNDAAERSTDTPPRPPQVISTFEGYTPPFDPVPIVERMLKSVQPKYLVGLQKVVLTNASNLPRSRRRAATKSRKRKIRILEARGLYHQAWGGEQAWIEIFLDNTLKQCERRWWTRLGFLREAEIADVLLHEIGHHIHFTSHPEYREKEDVADAWKVRLGREYLRERHPVLQAIGYPLRPLARILRKALSEGMVKRGMMSRAEFDEDFKKKSPKS